MINLGWKRENAIAIHHTRTHTPLDGPRASQVKQEENGSKRFDRAFRVDRCTFSSSLKDRAKLSCLTFVCPFYLLRARLPDGGATERLFRGWC